MYYYFTLMRKSSYLKSCELVPWQTPEQVPISISSLTRIVALSNVLFINMEK